MHSTRLLGRMVALGCLLVSAIWEVSWGSVTQIEQEAGGKSISGRDAQELHEKAAQPLSHCCCLLA